MNDVWQEEEGVEFMESMAEHIRANIANITAPLILIWDTGLSTNCSVWPHLQLAKYFVEHE